MAEAARNPRGLCLFAAGVAVDYYALWWAGALLGAVAPPLLVRGAGQQAN
jgi:hypothetical protein